MGLIDDGFDCRQSKPTSNAGLLGGKEWLKYLIEQFRGDSAAAVRYRQLDLPTLSSENILGDGSLSAKFKFSTFRHGISGVNGEVQQDLL